MSTVAKTKDPLEPVKRRLQDVLDQITDLLEAVTGAGPPALVQHQLLGPDQLAHLQGIRRAVRDVADLLSEHQSGWREAAERRRFLPRRLPRVRIRRRRPMMRVVVLSPEELEAAAELARAHARMRTDLEREAIETVGSTLEWMREREQDAARSNPELQPYLAAYFEQSRQTLLRTTGDLLAPTRTVDPPALVRPVPSRTHWPQSVSEPNERKDPGHGPA